MEYEVIINEAWRNNERLELHIWREGNSGFVKTYSREIRTSILTSISIQWAPGFHRFNIWFQKHITHMSVTAFFVLQIYSLLFQYYLIDNHNTCKYRYIYIHRHLISGRESKQILFIFMY